MSEETDDAKQGKKWQSVWQRYQGPCKMEKCDRQRPWHRPQTMTFGSIRFSPLTCQMSAIHKYVNRLHYLISCQVTWINASMLIDYLASHYMSGMSLEDHVQLEDLPCSYCLSLSTCGVCEMRRENILGVFRDSDCPRWQMDQSMSSLQKKKKSLLRPITVGALFSAGCWEK